MYAPVQIWGWGGVCWIEGCVMGEERGEERERDRQKREGDASGHVLLLTSRKFSLDDFGEVIHALGFLMTGGRG